MSSTRDAVAIAITIEDNEPNRPKTVRVTGPKEQWSAALQPHNIPETVAEVVREMLTEIDLGG